MEGSAAATDHEAGDVPVVPAGPGMWRAARRAAATHPLRRAFIVSRRGRPLGAVHFIGGKFVELVFRRDGEPESRRSG